MKLKAKLVVGWHKDELMRVLRLFVVGAVLGGTLGCD